MQSGKENAERKRKCRTKGGIPNEKAGKGRSVCCLLLCASLLLTSCGRPDGAAEGAVSGEAAVPDSGRNPEWVYVPEVISVGEKRADYERMQPVGNAFCYVSLGEETANSVRNICSYSVADGRLTSVPLIWPEGGEDWDVGYRFFTQEEELYMTANIYPADYGSMKRYLCKFDLKGNCLFSGDITEQAGRDVSVCGLTADGQGRFYLFLDNGEILLYTKEGEYHGAVNCNPPEGRMSIRIKDACAGADGKVYVCVGQTGVSVMGENAGGTEETPVRCTLLGIDFENLRLLKVAEDLPDLGGICAGRLPDGLSAGESADSGEPYDLLLYDDRAVYGYRFDASEETAGAAGEKLFAWLDSDINGYCVSNLYLMEDGRLCATVSDWLNDDRAAILLKRTEAENAPQRVPLVLAAVTGGSELAAMAVKFNRGNSRYHLTVKNYDSLTELYNAVLIREPVDLIDLSGLNVRRLAAQGFLEDLTPYAEQSEALKASEPVDGILEAYTFDGILTGIPSEFSLRTVVGNGAKLENKAGLTLEELLDVAARHPETQTFDGVTRDEMMQYLMRFNEDTFIDWGTGTCHFNSEDFQAVLRYVSGFPETVESGPAEESLGDRIQNGEVMFAVAELYPGALRSYEKIFGEGASCVGFPTAGGSGGHLLFGSGAYAIAAVSEHKESAWKFIEESLTREKGELYDDLFINYPTMKKKLEKKVGIAIERNEVTREEVDTVLGLLAEATPYFATENDEVIRIISEEAPACYSGQKGLADTAEVIQNRVRLYVNETL